MITHNNQTYKVVICTPAGREKYLSIFKKFIYRKIKEGLIDEWQLWLNTINENDISYLKSMEKENKKVKIYTIDEEIVPTWESYNALQTHKFFKYAQEDDTIYIRFDDDIIWVEEGALEKILQARIDCPNASFIYPNIINSTICTSWHQEIGALSEEFGSVNKEKIGDLDYAYLDAFNYTDSKLIDHIHKTFIKRFKEGSLSAYYLPNKSFKDYKHFSICSLCWWGKDKIQPTAFEEPQLGWEIAEKMKRPVFFVGNALMVHYAYHTQREYLTEKGDIYLDFYNATSV